MDGTLNIDFYFVFTFFIFFVIKFLGLVERRVVVRSKFFMFVVRRLILATNNITIQARDVTALK